MTVVQFPPRARRPSVVPLKPGMTLAGTEGHSGPITQSRFEEAHRLADDAERLPPMSKGMEEFFASADAKLAEVAGWIEAELLAMSNAELSEACGVAQAMTGEAYTAEEDFLAEMIAAEASRRSIGGTPYPDPDGAA